MLRTKENMDLSRALFHDGQLVSLSISGGDDAVISVVANLYIGDEDRSRQNLEFCIMGAKLCTAVCDLVNLYEHFRSGDISDGVVYEATDRAFLKLFLVSGLIHIEGKSITLNSRPHKLTAAPISIQQVDNPASLLDRINNERANFVSLSLNKVPAASATVIMAIADLQSQDGMIDVEVKIEDLQSIGSSVDLAESQSISEIGNIIGCEIDSKYGASFKLLLGAGYIHLIGSSICVSCDLQHKNVGI